MEGIQNKVGAAIGKNMLQSQVSDAMSNFNMSGPAPGPQSAQSISNYFFGLDKQYYFVYALSLTFAFCVFYFELLNSNCQLNVIKQVA